MSVNTGCVIIGRNEGDRLRQCLSSVVNQFSVVVYVDSGSTDQSVALAKDMGAKVVDLDLSVPFTAARARNAGVELLLQQAPETEYIQFIDGDCELIAGWLDAALAFLQQHSNVAVVCGRRRERYPEASLYNELCDIEWNTPVGEAKACGGDALMRVTAFTEVAGYNPQLIAGEEPEMCHRMRMQGWKIHRIEQEMTLHDAAISRFGQWWKRCARGGYAYFRVWWQHRQSEQQIWWHNVRRAVFWAAALPILFLLLLCLFPLIAILVPAAYLLLVFKVYRQRTDLPVAIRWRYAIFMVLAKFAELTGIVKALKDVLMKRRAVIMEYK